MKKNKKVILKVLVGSRAHGLANDKSDYDYRSVYILPTSKILSLGFKYKGNDWIEGENKDNTSYELGYFLMLATKCNPAILEVFKAPIIKAAQTGKKLRELFPCIWNPKQSFDAFVGYGLNQRKKFLDKKDNRQNKYAVTYIRTLYNLIELLDKKNFNVKMAGYPKEYLMELKQGNYKVGEVIQLSEDLIETAKSYLEKCKQVPDLEKVNQFLIKIRKEYW